MTRVICVQNVRYDVLARGFEGDVVFRRDEGPLTRRHLVVPGDPTWTHGQATRALTRRILTA